MLVVCYVAIWLLTFYQGKEACALLKNAIHTQVLEALQALEEARDALQAGHLLAAMHAAKRAKLLAEGAFFDPTMVSMLYFPDEHKFAVYMPFFVPVFVPLLSALVLEVRARVGAWRASRAAAAAKRVD